jgi:hypothetical protein
VKFKKQTWPNSEPTLPFWPPAPTPSSQEYLSVQPQSISCSLTRQSKLLADFDKLYKN